MQAAGGEAKAFWGGLSRDRKGRGLSGVEYLVSDARGGLRSAVARHFQGSAQQRCRVHFKRERMRKVSYKRAAELMRDAAAVFAPGDRAECLRRAGEAADKWRASCPAVAAVFEGGVGDCLTVLSVPGRRVFQISRFISRRALSFRSWRTSAINAPSPAGARPGSADSFITQPRTQLGSTPRRLASAGIVYPCSLTSLNADTLNSRVNLRRAMCAPSDSPWAVFCRAHRSWGSPVRSLGPALAGRRSQPHWMTPVRSPPGRSRRLPGRRVRR